jgi:hypothetical protein
MGYATRLGRARISAKNPQAAAVCDRCGIIYNHVNLRFQFDFAGTGIINKRLLVCETCNDEPQNQLRAIVLPADPIPVVNPRVFNFEAQRTDKRITIGETKVDPITSIKKLTGDQRTTQDNNDRIVQKNGDDMLAPKLVTFVRVTSYLDRRVTLSNDARITQWMTPFTPAPIPSPVPLKEAVRLTMEADIRSTQDGGIRDTIYQCPIEAITMTMNGQTRITEDTRIRETDYFPNINAPIPTKRVFKKRNKTEKKNG